MRVKRKKNREREQTQTAFSARYLRDIYRQNIAPLVQSAAQRHDTPVGRSSRIASLSANMKARGEPSRARQPRITFQDPTQGNTHLPLPFSDSYSIFGNLIANAGAHAVGDVADIRVTVQKLRKGRRIHIENPGHIPEDRLKTLFDSSKVASSSGEHYGMGLLEAKRVAELHGGTLTAKKNILKPRNLRRL